jgi:predicted ATPase
MQHNNTASDQGPAQGPNEPAKLDLFRKKVRDYRKQAGHTQNELAANLALHPVVLSNKLNGTNDAYLTNPEIKQIVLVLAGWQALTTAAEASELLTLGGLSAASFSPTEWQTAPLNELEQAGGFPGGPLPPETAKVSVVGLPAPEPPASSLPMQDSALVGRKNQLANLQKLLRQDGVRLVTLTGPGGIGKSRLALQVAYELQTAFKDGVRWVDLTPLTDPALVPRALMDALELQEPHGNTRPLAQTVADYLHDKQSLLVLDNFEQVMGAAPVLKTLLEKARQLNLLVTSRQVLRLRGEHEFDVPPLSLPDRQDAGNVQKIGRSEAISLFVQRAQAVRPDFELTPENSAAIIEICTRLDGMPLAIELAVPRLKLLTAQALLARLKGSGGQTTSLQLLTRGAVDTSERHRTIRNTIEWSYQALEAADRKLFRQLSVFETPFRVDTVEAVLTDETTLSAVSILDGLASLLDHSLLRRASQHQDERFVYLETIKEFAREKLAETGEESLVRQRHAAYYTELAEIVEREQGGSNAVAWYERLETEQADVRAALAWLLKKDPAQTETRFKTQAGNQFEQALRLSVGLGRFWLLHNHLSEGQRWLDAALAATMQAQPYASPTLRARAYHHLGAMFSMQGDYHRAKTHSQTALALWRDLDDDAGIALALNNLGNIAKEQGDYEQAFTFYSESLERNRKLGNTAGMAIAFNNLGNVALEQEDYEQATDLYTRSLTLKREVGYTLGVARSLINLGFVLVLKGAYEQALPLYEEAMALFTELGDRDGLGFCSFNIGEIALYQKDFSSAKTWLRRSLRIMWEIDNRSTLPRCLEGLAQAALAGGAAEQAVLLLGSAAALRENLEMRIPTTEQGRYNEVVRAARATLDEATFKSCWQQGKTQPLAQVVAFELAAES